VNEELTTLAEAYIADELSPQQLADLESQLRESERNRLLFLSYLEVHAGLAWHFRGAGISLPEQSGKVVPFPSRLSRRIMSVAAAIILIATLCFFVFRSSPATEPTIATIKANLHGQWANGEEANVGMKLHSGIWELQSGLVEIETQPGTILLLEGPASIELKDPLHAKLLAGNLVVRMPKGESGFVVDLPRMKVTDLGTEFGVSVTADGESRVQVYDGKVRAESRESGVGQELEKGQTLRCATDGEMIAAPFREDRFIRTFPPPNPGYQTGGPLYSKSTLESVNAVMAPSSVRTDGDLAEWDRAGTFNTACEPPYAPTYYLEGMMMYDAENLYLAAHVGDPHPMCNAARPGAEFAGGSVIFRLSTDRSLGWPLKGSTHNARSKSPLPDSLNEKVTTLVMWHDAKSGLAQITLYHSFDYRSQKAIPSTWSGAFRKDEDQRGYTLEYRIPWALLKCAEDPPQPGDQLAGLWMAHWSDQEGRVCRGQLVDVTNHDPQAISGIAPFVFFQNGPAWGKVNFLPRR
jgi:hypothetical protein